MSIKDLNNKPSWITRVQELDHIPGEDMPDNELLWAKLHQRLKERPARKRTWLYWAAAVCLLAAILKTVSWDTNRGSGKAVAIGQINIATHNMASGQTNLTAVSQGTNQAKGNKTIEIVVAKTSQEPANNIVSKKPATIIAETPILMVKPDRITDTAHPIDIVVNNPAPIVEKKKLRIVRINELPGSAEENDNLSHNNQFRRFAKGPGTDLSAGSNTVNHVLIKNLNTEN